MKPTVSSRAWIAPLGIPSRRVLQSTRPNGSPGQGFSVFFEERFDTGTRVPETYSAPHGPTSLVWPESVCASVTIPSVAAATREMQLTP